MKIHLVKQFDDNGEHVKSHLVRAHTRAGAERFVVGKIKPAVEATVATQDDIVNAMRMGVEIENAVESPQASIPEPDQTPE